LLRHSARAKVHRADADPDFATEPRKLSRQIRPEQLGDSRIFRLGHRCRTADQEHNHRDECQDLESDQGWNHFGFPSLGE
jgi:hypothetical protein